MSEILTLGQLSDIIRFASQTIQPSSPEASQSYHKMNRFGWKRSRKEYTEDYRPWWYHYTDRHFVYSLEVTVDYLLITCSRSNTGKQESMIAISNPNNTTSIRRDPDPEAQNPTEAMLQTMLEPLAQALIGVLIPKKSTLKKN